MPWVLTLFSIIAYSFPVWGEDNTKTFTFKNIIIETMGNQIYDMNANTITNFGHARVTIENVIIEADSVKYYGDQNLVELNGNIFLIKDQITVMANRLTLDTTTGWLEASGNVQLASPKEIYRSETLHYNLNQKAGEIGPLRGVVKGSDKDYFVTGKGGRLDDNSTIISPAGLTRCPRSDFSDYRFDARRIVVQGNDIYMEKVVVKILGIPLLYLPRVVLQGEEAPQINVDANLGGLPDLNEMINQSKTSAQNPVKSNKVHTSPRFGVSINTNDKPSILTVGKIFTWSQYSDEADVNFDSEGIFSLSDTFRINWPNYSLAFDGKTDLNSKPKRELGAAFTKKAWKTGYGNWQAGLLTRLLLEEGDNARYQGIYSGCRLDYQLTTDLSCSYLYIKDISGSQADWDCLEPDFLEINEYRLGSNFIYNANIPLNPHYYIFNKGGYSFRDSAWVSQVTGIAREVDCIKIGLGWDFAKDYIELQFRLKY